MNQDIFELLGKQEQIEQAARAMKSIAHPLRLKILCLVADEEMAARRAAWVAPPFKAERGVLAKYIRTVRTASEGCVTDL